MQIIDDSDEHFPRREAYDRAMQERTIPRGQTQGPVRTGIDMLTESEIDHYWDQTMGLGHEPMTGPLRDPPCP